ncbi:3-methyl-2-oxobutanoate hydroxymethyltransferase [Desulfocurvibacter africanus]|uniref:3-methyl-2-oxobutanoate hydroxymethyltransferase n=1 Tax=Desulfocurvibacter africanus subsp. africanus str. Walvis Bay TaxID=690850 RepID=F3YUG3_DESAF|nr:3-methyl-2-oxobutanoate hydroxymethyltransferase [Desulfocurvibacter africanus]EGJ48845.1 3-methyl-2-oxobutanoate hydroxymethyltransferase [Desulfocurvibacter africanus subsp. africanus str. Walvis Bay]
MLKPLTAPDIASRKGGERLAMLTAYDYPTALALDQAGADMLLVGDSLAMVVLGHPDTLSVTLDEMVHHTKAVSRAARRSLVVGDLPFLSYQAGVERAVLAAGRLVQEGGARAVKLEGAGYLREVEAMVRAGIPVMGHVGLTPQLVAGLGGFKVQGKTAETAARLVREAMALEAAGCFSIVLEAVPSVVAREITARVSIPTIGIGAGPHCDGQVLVIHDVLGLFERFTPKFVKRYAELGNLMQEAAGRYMYEVRQGAFPADEHGFGMDPQEAAAFRGLLNDIVAG